MVTLVLLLFGTIPGALGGLIDNSDTGIIDVDCKGGYGAWSQCEPFEGHDTHHDPDDAFDMKRAADGHYIGECFQFRTYHIITSPRGNGSKCIRKDGSKIFRYCSDCSSIPDVRKRLDSSQRNDQGMQFLAGIAGVFCLIATIIFGVLCLKKIFDLNSQERGDIPFYSPGGARGIISTSARPNISQDGCVSVGKPGNFNNPTC